MKKSTFTVLLAVLFIVQGLLAQQVEQVQRSLITKRTASWCPNCGSWGWAFFHDLIADNEDASVFLAAHYSGNLETEVAKDITSNFGGSYQPEFFFNSSKLPVTPFNSNDYRLLFEQLSDSASAGLPVANCGFTPVYANGAIEVNALTRFFQDATGTYYIGMYLVEDHVISYQSGQGNEADHRYVLRASFSTHSFGELLGSGTLSAGTELTRNFSLPIGEPTGYDYRIVGVIWKKSGDKYEVVNVWSTSTIETASATANANLATVFLLAPNLTGTGSTLTIDLKQGLVNAAISLSDLSGRVVQQIHGGRLSAGTHRFSLDLNGLPKGQYTVSLRSETGVRHQRLIVY